MPQLHRTDRLTAAVQPGVEGPEAFKQRYQALLRALRLAGPGDPGRARATRTATWSRATTSSSGRWTRRLMLRGSRDFASRDGVRGVPAATVRAAQCRAGVSGWRRKWPLLRPLPTQRLEACKRLRVRVDRGSTIHVQGNIYSVASRLIGERVEARLYAERGRGVVRPEVGGASCRACVDVASTASITGTSSTGWCVSRGRSPTTATARICFPASHFRMAYDVLCQQQPERAAKEYLRISAPGGPRERERASRRRCVRAAGGAAGRVDACRRWRRELRQQ